MCVCVCVGGKSERETMRDITKTVYGVECIKTTDRHARKAPGSYAGDLLMNGINEVASTGALVNNK